jgi:ABC-2 type transport system ATP-binding protein
VNPAGAADTVIDVSGLTKIYGTRKVVDNFSIQVRRGQIIGFLGPNGSGKTTTIRMLCGLLTPDSGEGQCLGHDIRTESQKIKREVGYMTQRFSLYEDLSIAENLDFVARVYGVAQRHQVVDETLERLGLGPRRNQLAGALSGGWKQRLALAACLLHKPQLLLLDEPTAGVDPKARREFWDQIHDLAAQGLTVLASTHYMDEAERCHSLAYIAYGQLLARGTATELIAQSGLHTWAMAGADLQEMAATLRGLPGVEMVVPFGTSLHVSGKDDAMLQSSLAAHPGPQGAPWTRIAPGLEDVFISLMNAAPDNFQ